MRNGPAVWCTAVPMKPASEGEDGLQHRYPAGHPGGIRSKGPAVRSSLDLEQLCIEPESLGRKEIPLHPAAILMGVAELPAHPRAAAIDHDLFRRDEVTRGELA